jgi:N-acetyl-anhydromuramyl-L-alanine amidase AmpD
MKLVSSIPVETTGYKLTRDIGVIDTIVFHHSGSNNDNIRSIHEYHKTKFKALGIVYHFVIGKDGTVSQTRALEDHTPHCRNHNKKSIGICILGDYSSKNLTKLQEDAIVFCVHQIYKWCSIKSIKCHCDLVPTACPGMVKNSIRELVKLKLI